MVRLNVWPFHLVLSLGCVSFHVSDPWIDAESSQMYALVADDSGVIRTLVKQALVELGASKIDEAVDGREAIEQIGQHTYDFVVTDLNMPYYSGLDVVKAVRITGNTCPVVMQTTEADKNRVLQAIAAGVNDYVLKPFTKESMIQRLERFFN